MWINVFLSVYLCVCVCVKYQRKTVVQPWRTNHLSLTTKERSRDIKQIDGEIKRLVEEGRDGSLPLTKNESMTWKWGWKKGEEKEQKETNNNNKWMMYWILLRSDINLDSCSLFILKSICQASSIIKKDQFSVPLVIRLLLTHDH